MEQKLQELLNKLYHEGVEKGEDVAAAIVKDAEKKAAEMIRDAEKDAEDILKQAREEAKELRRNVISELDLAAAQSVSALKQKISNLITTGVISDPIHQVFSDDTFIRDIIEDLIEKWDPGKNGHGGLSILLPPEKGKELYRYFYAKAATMLNGTLQVNFDHKLSSGFRIGPANGSYVISFSEKDFEVFFKDYLRPRTRELLFGDKKKNNNPESSDKDTYSLAGTV